MRNGMRLTVSGGLVAALFLFAGAAAAQVKASTSSAGYGYQFDDDPLNTSGFQSGEAAIRVRICGPRTALIRPRISFIPSMLKSVESL